MNSEELVFQSNNLSTEKVLINWLDAWKQKEWVRMKEFSQITWKANEKNPEETLSTFYKNTELLSFELNMNNKWQPIGKCICKIPLVVRYYFVNAIYSATCLATLVQEQAPYAASFNGNWGVNPISMLKRTVRKEVQSNE